MDLAGAEDVSQMALYNEELNAVRVQVEAMREEVCESRRALLRSNGEVAKLTLILDSKTAELTKLRKEYGDNMATLQADVARLESCLDKEKHSAVQQEDLLEAKGQEIDILRGQVAGLETANGRMLTEIEQLKAGTEREATLLSATRKAFEGATTYQDELQTIAEDYERKHEANERKIAQLTIELDGVKEDYEHLFAKYKRQWEKMQKIRSFYDRSVEDLRGLRSKSPAVSLAEFDRAMGKDASRRADDEEAAKPVMAASHVATKRELKAKDFPKKTSDMSFTVYYESLQNYVGHLMESGYEDAVVAEELFQALSQGSLASPFLHRYKREERPAVLTTSFLMQTLEKVDFAYHHLSAEDRYRVVRIREGEANVDYLQRCEREYDAIFPDEMDKEKRFYEIKRRFIEGGNFPIWQQDRLRPYATLRELLFGAETLSNRETQRQRQVMPRPRQVPSQTTVASAGPGTRSLRPAGAEQGTSAAATATFDPFLTQAQFQGQHGSSPAGDRDRGIVAVATPNTGGTPPVLQTYNLRDGSVSFRPPPRDRLNAPAGAKRAPIDAELTDQRFSFCGNCRMYTHPTAVCHFKSFCARCNVEGRHEDRKCPQRTAQPPTAGVLSA